MLGQSANRVMLVDDDPLIRRLILRWLSTEGYVVKTAEDGLDAIGKLRAGLPDLLISDLNMPRMSGVEFLGVVRRRLPQIPVIVISGVPADALPTVAHDAYCLKSESLSQQLLQTVSELTRKPSPRTAPPPVGTESVLARWNGSGGYIINCPDCLREFTSPRASHLGKMKPGLPVHTAESTSSSSSLRTRRVGNQGG